MSGGGFRVSSIPNSVRKTIQNIKEITGNHSEDEIYAMLKECSMDPNETAQRLLLQDPFHEVKRKRDRKKEVLNNKESAESRWRPGSQGRGSRGGWGNFPRSASHEADGSKSSGPGRDNGMNQVAEKGSGQSLSTLQESKTKESTLVASPVSAIANGPSGVVAETFSAPLRKAANQPQENSAVGSSEFGSAPSPVNTIGKSTIAFGSGDMSGEPAASSSDCSMSTAPAPASSSAICFSSSDPVLVPSTDSRLLNPLDTIKHESNRASTEPNAVIPTEIKLASEAAEINSSFLQGKMPNKSSGVVKNPPGESAHPSSTVTHGSSASRPSSNYSSRSQQIIGPQKVGSNKEWKPKPVICNVGLGSGAATASEVPTVSLEINARSLPVSSVLDSEVATSKLEKKLEELHLPQRQHVIIPNHIHVPESERTKLSFGSFDASFGVALNYIGGQESDKSSTPLSEASQDADETAEEHGSSNQNALATAEEGDYADRPQSPAHAPENLSGDIASSIPESDENKQENTLLSGGNQHSAVTSPNYSFGVIPPMVASFGNAESQAREVSRLSSFVVPHPFDPATYYAQFYRSSVDNDGRVSPFASSGVAAKYNGNVSVLPPQTSQSQEGGNSLVLTTTSSSPVVTQAAGMMQSSLAVTQQPVPVYRSAAGVHLPHYPPNYIQYAPFYSPFYVPSPAIHQFINNGVFPQQPQAGTVYPSVPAAPTTGVKFSLPQFKPGSNTPSSIHIGMPSGYGPYGSSPAGYNPSSAVATGNSTTNEDLSGTQFKESNVYVTGQQSEGSAVWIAPPGRDISSLPASSFYNLAPQGQNVTFAPTQVVPGSFAGIYHPQAATAAAVHPLLQQAQTMAGAVNMGGSAAGVYRQPQHAQMNWPSNY
ncbi:GBF-interacting protein 1-like [Gossypium arboreum]|uniref:GBF-interacting protein 1 N-terminal domain-containing protein n=1 Tax=Gossypium arboreum TaxID=29729 RepID=A0ABR0P9Z4_GOSAR|nr:GBF-interacting protein 1-like [Gossypium arboreum]KAK5818104.1 hypothetical protein PVK06_023035 [Gossypium arboreum]